MSTMDSPTVIRLDRNRRVRRAMAARRQLHEVSDKPRPRPGRLWLNGTELGEPRSALAHLSESYD